MTGVVRTWIAGALLCVIVLSMATSATASSVWLTTPAEGNEGPWAGMALTVTKPNVSYSLGLDVVCTLPKGTVRITGARPYGVMNDLRVVAFGTRPDTATRGTSRMGSSTEPLAALGFDTTSPTVGTACARTMADGRPENFTEFAVQLQRPTDQSASAEGILVDYIHGQTKGTLDFKIEIGLCGKDRPPRSMSSEESDPPCAR
ncbi:hypothetical protein [Tenggerimyces flavus]|uniref:Uncharacterized protein n=1 Tax=Tenggerimyces flavus TaxID=1708749 RepID=A0ABV7YN05_9ACTN|nr:hypothetical protein [Tenggerimyces flavus]MBM7787686.1 hypothetical protein [Tenggerimyces flavus]